jgi:carbonic anhydrase
MLTFKDDDLRKKLKACTHHAHHPLIDQTSFLPFDDVEGSIKEDVEFLKRNPLILKESVITGWVYETETGKVRQVA